MVVCESVKIFIRTRTEREREREEEEEEDTKEESGILSILIYDLDFRRLCLSDKVVHADAAPAPMDILLLSAASSFSRSLRPERLSP